MDTATVYFLGAGASKDAGIPLTAGLLPRVKANIRDRSDRDDLRRFVQTFDTGGSGQSGRAPIVELISFLDNAIRTERPLGTFFKLDRLRDVRRQLTVEVAKAVVSRKGARVEVPEDALDTPGATTLRVASYYRTFVQKLVGRDRTLVSEADLPLGDTVVTTNYDISIDVALYEAAYSEERRGGSSSVTTTAEVQTFISDLNFGIPTRTHLRFPSLKCVLTYSSCTGRSIGFIAPTAPAYS